MKYRLIDFFDVWGNEKDGWEVNDQCVIEEELWISDDASDKEILEFLKMIEFLSTSDMRRVCLKSDGNGREIQAVKGHMPLGYLEPKEG